MGRLVLTGFADEAAIGLKEQVQALRTAGLSHVELRMVDGISVADFDHAMAQQVHQTLEAARIEVSCLGSPIGKISVLDPIGPHLDVMKRLCQTAHQLETDRIRVFSFFIPQGKDPADYRGKVIDQLGRLLELAESEGCVLLHENERDIYGDIPDRCLDLHRTFGTRLRGILDPANYLLVDADPWQAMQALEPWIDYLHVKDVRRSDQRIVPAGAGDGSLAALMRVMRNKPGDRFLSVEPHLTHFSGRDQLEKDSSQTREDDGDYTYPDGLTAFLAAVNACRTLSETIEAEATS